MEEAISEWINACPYACESYIDDNANVIVTVITDEETK